MKNYKPLYQSEEKARNFYYYFFPGKSTNVIRRKHRLEVGIGKK